MICNEKLINISTKPVSIYVIYKKNKGGQYYGKIFS